MTKPKTTARTSKTKEVREELKRLYDDLEHRASGAGWEVRSEVGRILSLMGEDTDDMIEDPVYESHLTDVQVEKVRDQKKSGTFAGPDPNP